VSSVESLPVTLTEDDVAALYHVKTATVKIWMYKGWLPRPDGPGKKRIWLAETIVNHLRKGKKPAVSA
jgi:hypothetical protein